MFKKAFFACLLGAAFLVGTTACGGEKVEKEVEIETTHDHGNDESHEGHDHTHEGAEMAEAAYYCPMECEGEKTYAEAGSCPVCGMDLVEKAQD